MGKRPPSAQCAALSATANRFPDIPRSAAPTLREEGRGQSAPSECVRAAVSVWTRFGYLAGLTSPILGRSLGGRFKLPRAGACARSRAATLMLAVLPGRCRRVTLCASMYDESGGKSGMGGLYKTRHMSSARTALEAGERRDRKAIGSIRLDAEIPGG